MEVTLKKAFSIIDGRLSTKIEDVYEMLNYIYDTSFMTHQLPTAMRTLKKENPDWFKGMVDVLNDIKKTNKTNDFDELMLIIDESFPTHTFKLGKLDKKIGFLDGIV